MEMEIMEKEKNTLVLLKKRVVPDENGNDNISYQIDSGIKFEEMTERNFSKMACPTISFQNDSQENVNFHYFELENEFLPSEKNTYKSGSASSENEKVNFDKTFTIIKTLVSNAEKQFTFGAEEFCENSLKAIREMTVTFIDAVDNEEKTSWKKWLLLIKQKQVKESLKEIQNEAETFFKFVKSLIEVEDNFLNIVIELSRKIRWLFTVEDDDEKEKVPIAGEGGDMKIPLSPSIENESVTIAHGTEYLMTALEELQNLVQGGILRNNCYTNDKIDEAEGGEEEFDPLSMLKNVKKSIINELLVMFMENRKEPNSKVTVMKITECLIGLVLLVEHAAKKQGGPFLDPDLIEEFSLSELKNVVVNLKIYTQQMLRNVDMILQKNRDLFTEFTGEKFDEVDFETPDEKRNRIFMDQMTIF